MRLTPKLRALLVKQISTGVPPVCAGLMYAIPKKQLERWVQLGHEATSEPFADLKRNGMYSPDGQTQEPDGTYIKNSDYEALAAKHHRECQQLTKAVMETDGKIVGALFKRIVKSSMRSQDMQKFLFKHFTHIHGMREQAPNKPIEIVEGDIIDPVTIELPDNGRMISIPVGPNA